VKSRNSGQELAASQHADKLAASGPAVCACD
jgi:hypothetical protein